MDARIARSLINKLAKVYPNKYVTVEVDHKLHGSGNYVIEYTIYVSESNINGGSNFYRSTSLDELKTFVNNLIKTKHGK